jgi:hypothetical protein
LSFHVLVFTTDGQGWARIFCGFSQPWRVGMARCDDQRRVQRIGVRINS